MALPGVAPDSLKVLVVGGGGREHALTSALERSPYLKEIVALPGNVGMGAHVRRLSHLSAEDVPAIVDAAIAERPDLVVVGPEVCLVDGVVDSLRDSGIRAFGPTAAAAALEGSKAFSKRFMERHGIPTAAFARFTDAEAAKKYVRERGAPVVVKADGLAAGKGVVIAHDVDEACDALDGMLIGGRFGDAGSSVVVEEFLEGEELSFFAVCDGKGALPLASAQDHKAVGDGDTGPNTGGMGAYSPAPVCDAAMARRVMEEVVRPTVEGMRSEGAEFRGVLFVGLMVDAAGSFKVLEFNVRFGDPECQVLCTRMKSDLLELLYRAADGDIGDFDFAWEEFKALVVVLASEGYPGAYKKGGRISGIDRAEKMNGVKVFHAGTADSADGELVSDGGRVLGVTATGDTIAAAQKKAYEAVSRIEWKDGFCRSDIGWRAVKRE